jgi:hypothetical protein
MTRRDGNGLRLHHLEADEGSSQPCAGSVRHAAERSGGGEWAKPRAGACVLTQSAAESEPVPRLSQLVLKDRVAGHGFGYRLWRSPSRPGLPALAFAFTTYAIRFGCLPSCFWGLASAFAFTTLWAFDDSSAILIRGD